MLSIRQTPFFLKWRNGDGAADFVAAEADHGRPDDTGKGNHVVQFGDEPLDARPMGNVTCLEVDDPERNPDSVGSAVTGGYLNQLGFKTGAIAYMTELGPDEMRWLTPEDAERLGIYYEVWDYAFEALGSVNSYRNSSSRLKLRSR